jgi:hypothetical protein
MLKADTNLERMAIHQNRERCLFHSINEEGNQYLCSSYEKFTYYQCCKYFNLMCAKQILVLLFFHSLGHIKLPIKVARFWPFYK